ncbi:MAG: exodeoxyribonuclease V subunit gamma [Clostridia bacterium]|nr:exodeoxyribonuclease V subunit gamma [Clostridia bacterium]
MRTVIEAYTLSECMEEVSKYAEAYEKLGGKNLIFCEDRLTLIAERALLSRMGGTFSTSVSTFARFVKTEGRAISKQGSVMAVGEVMTRLQREGKLQCFTTLSGIGNNARCVYETLAQMSASKVSPTTLKDSLALLAEDALKSKVADLTEIYEGYTLFLKENGYLDESEYLSLLPQRIREEGILKGYNVFFLCYSSFTAQACEAVRAVLETAENVVGVFCGGEEELYTNRAKETFLRVCEEYGKTRVVNLGTPLFGEAEVLRKGLFEPLQEAPPRYTENVRIFEAADKGAEVEFVAAKIRREMAETPSLRYRDIAVLVPSAEGYALSVKKTFAEYKIPFFIDEKRSLKRHPLSEFLLACLRVVRERFTPSSVQALAQNLFFGESDEYRNYLLKFANYRGGAKRLIKTGEAVEKSFDVARLSAGRERLLKATENIKARGQGREYCAAIVKIMQDFEVEKTLKDLEGGLDDLAQKSYLAQISSAIEGVLKEALLLTGDKEMTVAEFETVLQNGLGATEISLIPLKADAVFVGDIAQSRIEKVGVLFALGMTEEVPYAAADTAIISDKEMQRLAEVKSLLEPSVAEVNLRTRESVGLNLCTFYRRLYLTYPLSVNGDEPALSEIFRYIDGLFCEENGGRLLRRKKYEKADFAYQCGAVTPAIRQLLLEKEDFEKKRDLAQEGLREEYSSLYAALESVGVREMDEYLIKRGGQVSIERGEELFFKDGRISPTSLEEYFSCPFRHFAERGLKLKNREEAVVLAVDSGNFVHLLLEKVTKELDNVAKEEDMRRYAIKVGRELLQESVYAMQQDTASGAYFLEKLLKEGAEAAVAVFRQVKNSAYTIEATEKEVKGEFFRGKVDRVDETDEFVRVIDYKTGKIDDSALSYYTGQKLQMQLYMSELKGKKKPAGVFYFPASLEFGEEDGRFRMRGFLNGSEAALRCGDKNISETEKSEYFPASLKNNARAKRVMEEEEFSNFVDYSVFAARKACGELKEGYIAPSPYEGSCEYCKYGGMCGFTTESSVRRKEGKIEPTTIAEIARKEKYGKED